MKKNTFIVAHLKMLLSIIFALLVCSETVASDIEIYQASGQPNKTLMIQLDNSQEMGCPTGFDIDGDKNCSKVNYSKRKYLITFELVPLSLLPVPNILTVRACSKDGVTLGSDNINDCNYDTSIFTDLKVLIDGLARLVGRGSTNIVRISNNRYAYYRGYYSDSIPLPLNSLKEKAKQALNDLPSSIQVGLSAYKDGRGYIVAPAKTLMSDWKSTLKTEIDKLTVDNNPRITEKGYAETTSYLLGTTTTTVPNDSGFSNSNYWNIIIANTSNYKSPIDTSSQCNAQGIYVVNGTDSNARTQSLMASALGKPFNCSDGTSCMDSFNKSLDRGNTNNNIIIKHQFTPLNDVSSNSLNNFLGTLTPPTAPPALATSGGVTIPVDPINPTKFLPYAYMPQLQPTPDMPYKLWLGNLTKYNVKNDKLIGSDNTQSVFDNDGVLQQNTKDLWGDDTGNGVKPKIPLRFDNNNSTQRKLLSNRDARGGSTSSLNQILATNNYLSSTSDRDRGYLVSLLGFNVNNPDSPPQTIDGLKQLPELRQVGAVMHSAPQFFTNSATIRITSNAVDISNRTDYVLFGTTQGLLHVVDSSTGVEKFAFLPNEMVSAQKRAFLDYTQTTQDSTQYYGVDAPWNVYSEYVPTASDANTVTVGQGVNNTQGMQMAYGGLRMGGRSYYALDLKDIDNPVLAFRIDPNSKKVYSKDSTVNNTSYKPLQFMAQSWSKPTVGYVKWDGVKRLVMFVGGGYDAGYEGDSYDQTDQTYQTDQTDQQGAGVYMFDARTGQLLWWTGAKAIPTNNTAGVAYTRSTNMKYSIPSEIKAVDTTESGLINHLYFGDLGGQVWRVDLDNSATSTNSFAKTPVRILNLNNGLYSPRFYEKPAYTSYANGAAVVSIGSGNRSRPLLSFPVAQAQGGYSNDAIYNIFDKDVLRPNIYTTQTYNTFDIAKSNLANANTGTVPNNSKGWFYEFGNASTLQVEKVLSYPIVIKGDLYVTTYDSSAPGTTGQCGIGIKGKSKTYVFNNFASWSGGPLDMNQYNIGIGIVAPSVGPSSTGEGKTLISTVATSKNSNTNPFKSYNNSGLKRLGWYELEN